MRKSKLKLSYEKYSIDYLTHNDDEDDRLFTVKERLQRLPLPDKKIFLMYVESGTYSEVAKRLKCSVPTVSKKIKMIIEKLNYDFGSGNHNSNRNLSL